MLDDSHSLLGKRVAFIGAHPDDESFTCGGTLSLITASGGTVDLLVATRGERGRAYVDANISDEDFIAMRREELGRIAETIGVRSVTLLEYPDGSLREHIDGFETAAAAQLALWESELVIGFGRDGYTGHADHIAAAAASRRAAEALGIPYLAVALPDDYKHEFRELLSGKRKHGIYDEELAHAEHTFSIAVDPIAKMNLLRIYHSQFDGLDPYTIFPRELADHFLCNEYFSHTH